MKTNIYYIGIRLFLAIYLVGFTISCSPKIVRAASKNDVETVRELIKEGVDLNSNFDTYDSPLYYASKYGYLEIVRLLLEGGAETNPDLHSSAISFPLLEASRNGFIEIVKLLVDFGAPMDQESTFGDTPLVEALKVEHNDVAKYLIEKGADVNHKETEFSGNKVSPLQVALYNQKVATNPEKQKENDEIVTLLKLYGASYIPPSKLKSVNEIVAGKTTMNDIAFSFGSPIKALYGNNYTSAVYKLANGTLDVTFDENDIVLEVKFSH